MRKIFIALAYVLNGLYLSTCALAGLVYAALSFPAIYYVGVHAGRYPRWMLFTLAPGVIFWAEAGVYALYRIGKDGSP